MAKYRKFDPQNKKKSKDKSVSGPKTQPLHNYNRISKTELTNRYEEIDLSSLRR